MKILCAPDSFKESLNGLRAALAMAEGVLRAQPDAEIEVCSVADGGEGTLDALVSAWNGSIHFATVTGPMGQPIRARWGPSGDESVAIVELAQASGLSLVDPKQRNPLRTSTLGTGELIKTAMDHGCQEIIIGLGGSATVDGGTGIAQALGVKFLDQSGEAISEPLCGGMLQRIAKVELPPRLADARSKIRLRAACDVTNPLCGESGAAAVYGPQKGATAQQVETLDAGLRHLAEVTGGDPDQPGAGAAGGAGYGLATLLGATLERGVDLVLDAVGFNQRCRGSTVVFTGEGRLDAQSLQGKACMGVAQAAARQGVPTIAIVGSAGPGARHCVGDPDRGLLLGYISLEERFGRERALREPAELLAQIAEEVARDWASGRGFTGTHPTR